MSTTPSPATPGITGYRNLSPDEKALMNAVKAHAESAQALIASIAAFQVREVDSFKLGTSTMDSRVEHARLVQEGQRWRMRAVDTLQDGYMQLVRSIARPTTF